MARGAAGALGELGGPGAKSRAAGIKAALAPTYRLHVL